MIDGLNIGAFPSAQPQDFNLCRPLRTKRGLVFAYVAANALCQDPSPTEIVDLCQRNVGLLPNGGTYNEPGGYIGLNSSNQRISLPSWDTASIRAKFTISIKFSHITNTLNSVFSASNSFPFAHSFGLSVANSANLPHVYIMAGGTAVFIPYSTNTDRNIPVVVTLTVDRERAIAHYRIDAAAIGGLKNVTGSFVPGSENSFSGNTINGFPNGTFVPGIRLYSFFAYENFMAEEQLEQLHRVSIAAGHHLDTIPF